VTAGFRGGGSQVAMNFSGRVNATLPEKLTATGEPLSLKMASKTVQSRENAIVLI